MLSFLISLWLVGMTVDCCVHAFSSSITTNTAQTVSAKIMAQNFESFQLKQLEEAGVLDIQRPYTIIAEAANTAEQSMRGNFENNKEKCIASKLIHFQRHGQGYHNLIGEMVRESTGKPIDLDDKDPQRNPFIRPELLDSPLTEKGRQECQHQRHKAAQLNPQMIICSPLHRAIQTALLSFADHRSDTIPWVVHEGAREQHGLLYCNKRRSVKETQAEFPFLDFSPIESNDDRLWQPHQRETPLQETQRIYDFLIDYVMELPQDELAVVGHSAWLFSMLNGVVECSDDAVKSLFATSEIRTLRLNFYQNDNFSPVQ